MLSVPFSRELSGHLFHSVHLTMCDTSLTLDLVYSHYLIPSHGLGQTSARWYPRALRRSNPTTAAAAPARLERYVTIVSHITLLTEHLQFKTVSTIVLGHRKSGSFVFQSVLGK